MSAVGPPRARAIVPDRVSATALHELVVMRVFDAPRQRVFRAWTMPELLALWWGPYGSTNAGCEVDLRRGGRWNIRMRSAAGDERPLQGRIQEVVEAERLVLRLRPDEEHIPEGIELIVLFEDLDGPTRLTVRARFASAASGAVYAASGARRTWGQGFDSLEELLLKGRVR